MTYFTILLLFHVLGDFYLQTQKLSESKKHSNKHLLLHTAIYTLPFVLMFCFNDGSESILRLFIGIVILFISHFIIDFYFRKKDKTLMPFIIDQLLHLLVIFIVWFLIKNHLANIDNLDDWLISDLGLNISFQKLVSITTIMLLIVKPTSILVELSLPEINDNKEKDIDKDDKKEQGIDKDNKVNYGSIIGVLERFVIVLLAIINLWTSIAIVITAKSIARFKQLEDKEFSQKYLIGTLLSVAMVLVYLIVLL